MPINFKDNQAIKAKDILDHPDDLYAIQRPFILMLDTSMMMTFPNAVQALEVLHEAGFDVVSTSVYGTSMHILMRSTNYKRKNFVSGD